jgi:hypothetical protein
MRDVGKVPNTDFFPAFGGLTAASHAKNQVTYEKGSDAFGPQEGLHLQTASGREILTVFRN